jgi:DeoR family transcriptional regulator of aga operon
MHRFASAIDSSDLTIVTTGVESHAVLSHRDGIRAILTGGELERSTGALIGPSAERTIRDYVYERAFVSPTFLDARIGATEQTAEGAEVKRTMRLAARSTVVGVDSTKLENSSLARLFGFDDIDILVTELDAGDPLLDLYRDQVEIL